MEGEARSGGVGPTGRRRFGTSAGWMSVALLACEAQIPPPEGVFFAEHTNGEVGGLQAERCASGPAAENVTLPVFDRLFEGHFRLINHFDHDEPRAFADHNGHQTDWCGRVRRHEIDGHAGYDFLMPEGTALFAPADGEILRAGLDGRFYCPFRGGDVDDQIKVDIAHTLPDGRRVVSTFKHLSRLLVSSGQVVRRGEVIGLSGNTGCSTDPHLHFETWLSAGGTPSAGPAVLIDPYGWQGLGPDPWAAKVHGAASIWLWRPGQAPDIFSP